MEEIIADVDRLIVPALTHWSHPSFFAYFATSTSAPGIFGELLTAAFDNKAMLWRTSPASTELEEVTLDWLRQMMGLDPGMTGIIYDTASVSSMHAIAAAREGVEKRIREEGMSGRTDLPLLRVYVSEQAHSSIEKGVITLGLGQRGLRKIPTDTEFRMDARALAEAIERRQAQRLSSVLHRRDSRHDINFEHRSGALRSFPSVKNMRCGCTSMRLMRVRRRSFRSCDTSWMVVSARIRWSVNPHKWLFTPFDLSVLYCRHMDLLRRAFSLVPEYLRTPEQEKVRSGSDYGIQLGRRFRALKLWMVIRYFGHEGLAARIREHCRLAKLFASWVEESPDWELMAPVPLALGLFSCLSEEAKATNADDVERSDHAWRECDWQSVALAHETERQTDAAAIDRKYSHDGKTRATGLGVAKRTVASYWRTT